MPKKFVFPGGAVEETDFQINAFKPLNAICKARMAYGCNEALVHALTNAAIRELFEETGIILGAKEKWTGMIPHEWKKFVELGLVPDGSNFQFVFRAITPPGRPRRFDARFFYLDADHLSAAPYIQKKLGGKLCISKEIIKVQKLFGKIYNAGTEFELDGSQFDKLLSDNDEYKLGNIASRTIATPGHTPACMAHLIGDAVFVGDTLFMPDGGTARADFPGGSAEQLYKSIQRILALPDKTRLFVCHDYMPNNRDPAWETTVLDQKNNNCLLYTSPSPRDRTRSRMPSSA